MLDDTVTVGAVNVTAASSTDKGLEVNASAAISSLKVTADTELNIADGEALSGQLQ